MQRLYSIQYTLRQWLAGWWHGVGRSVSPAPALARRECPRRVLLVVSGLLGDTVMSTPVVLEARRLWPEAEITILGRRDNCQLLANCPAADHFIETDYLPFSWRGRRALAELERKLRSHRFDVAIIILGDQFARMLQRAEIPVRVGVSGSLLEPYLTHSYDIGEPRTWGPTDRLNSLRALGCEVENARPRLWVDDHSRGPAMNRLVDAGLNLGEPYAVLHPFGSTLRQWWPANRVCELAEALHNEIGLRTVLIGGPEVRGTVTARQGAFVDATGRLSIPELLAVIDQARLVISTDSGPFHIGGALDRPLIGLFRAQRPEHAARYSQARVVFGEHPLCAGQCSWNCCGVLPCRQMVALSVREVLDLVPKAADCSAAV